MHYNVQETYTHQSVHHSLVAMYSVVSTLTHRARTVCAEPEHLCKEIYNLRYQCGELAYNEEYIGETSSTFGERYKEHPKEPSPIHAHSTQTGHSTNAKLHHYR